MKTNTKIIKMLFLAIAGYTLFHILKYYYEL